MSSFLLLSLLTYGEDGPLTECTAIRALPRDVAAQGRKVQLQAVVTFVYRKREVGMVVQKNGVGIYVDTKIARTNGWISAEDLSPDRFERGTLIELSGITGPGHFAPVIYPKHIKVVGNAPIPEPTRVSFADLLDGRWDCQSVRIRGVVQYAEDRSARLERVRLELVANGGRITVNVLEPIPDLHLLIDSEAEVDGVATTYFNSRGELVGTRLLVMNPAGIRVLREGARDPFAAPELSLTNLLPFSPEGVTFHRRRFNGTVTLAWPGRFFYIQDGGRGVRVETRDTTPLAPGDRVEVSGFVEVKDHFGKIREAVVRKVGVAPHPAPIRVERQRVLGSRHRGSVTDADDTNGLFATLYGRLEKVDLLDVEGPRLLVESEGYLVTALLGAETSPGELERFVPGSEVRIDGVIRVNLASGWPAQDFPVPMDFQMYVHKLGDVTILRAAPWWNAQRLWLLVGGIGFVLAAMLAWNWLLRRRVELKGAQLAEAMRAQREAAVEFDATLRERERLAADLHDTLEQSLTGIAFRLETMVVRREKAQDFSSELDRVRQLFASTREDVRRSIWNLRANALNGRTLPEAIRSSVSRLTGGRNVMISVETDGTVRALPDFIAGNLLLLAVESVTNALKHADPRLILVSVSFASDTVALAVEDDGRGFDVAQAPGPAEGHFGIQGMRERAKRLGGMLEVSSTRAKGSRLAVTVPVR